MKKLAAIAIFLTLATSAALAQTGGTRAPNIRPSSVGLSLIFNDFVTPDRIRSGSLTSVLRDKRTAKLGDMSPGLALTYSRGLRRYIDFSTTLAGSFTEGLVVGRSNTDNALLVEGDASLNFKMVDENYWVIPYLSAGIGFSKYKGYYGALMPLGAGLRVNFFNEAHLVINTQYRIPVTTATNNYHFFHSIGIAGVIGKD